MHVDASYRTDKGKSMPINAVVVVSPYPPSPLKRRTFSIVKALANRVNVHLVYVDEPVPLTPSKERLLKMASAELADNGVKLHRLEANRRAILTYAGTQVLSGKSLHASLYSHPQLARQFSSLCEELKPDVIHIDRLRAVPISRYVNYPAVVDLTDPLGVMLEWQGRHGAKWLRPLRFLQCRSAWRDEASVTLNAPVIFASTFGSDDFRSRVPWATCFSVPHPVGSLQFPVKSELFEKDRIRLCFAGNLSYWPNVNGLVSFINYVWPQVKKEFHGATLTLTGSNPSRQLQRLAIQRGVGIVRDPFDIHTEIRKADLAIAPLKFCGGFCNKVADALVGAGIPILATPQALRGLPSSVTNALPRAETLDEWITCISQFGNNPESWWLGVEHARQALARELNADACTAALIKVYSLAVSAQDTRNNSFSLSATVKPSPG